MLKGLYEMVAVRDLFNEWYVRDTSKKIRAVKQARGKAGERLAIIPPYGYRKDVNDPKQLVIDDESAAVAPAATATTVTTP